MSARKYTSQEKKSMREAVSNALASVITKAQAEARGLEQITRGFNMADFRFAIAAIELHDGFPSERKAALVRRSTKLVEIWAKPYRPVKIPSKKR